MPRFLAIAAYVLLVVYALADVAQAQSKRPFGVPKWVWVVAILIFPYLGAIAWIVVKWVSGSEGDARPTPGPGAPDDDPEYLRWLRDQEARRRQRRDGEAT